MTPAEQAPQVPVKRGDKGFYLTKECIASPSETVSNGTENSEKGTVFADFGAF